MKFIRLLQSETISKLLASIQVAGIKKCHNVTILPPYYSEVGTFITSAS